MKKNKKQKIILIIIIVITLLIDQITKIIAYNQGWNISTDVIMDTSNNGYYIIMSMIIVLMIIRYISNDNTFIKIERERKY